jgi:hypothetical protein
MVTLFNQRITVERPDAMPNPAVEVRQSLPDGTAFKAVWSRLRQSGVAKLATVHFLDRGESHAHSRRANQADTVHTDREISGCGRSRDGRPGR